MKRRIGPFQRLAVFALLTATGGCELIKHVRIQADDRNPNSFAATQEEGPRGDPARLALEFRLWPHEAAD